MIDGVEQAKALKTLAEIRRRIIEGDYMADVYNDTAIKDAYGYAAGRFKVHGGGEKP